MGSPDLWQIAPLEQPSENGDKVQKSVGFIWGSVKKEPIFRDGIGIQASVGTYGRKPDVCGGYAAGA